MASRQSVVFKYFALGNSKSALNWTQACQLHRKTQLHETIDILFEHTVSFSLVPTILIVQRAKHYFSVMISTQDSKIIISH
jgi:hypothetical protein